MSLISAKAKLSKGTYQTLKDVSDDLQDMVDNEKNLSRGGTAMCERCIRKIGGILKSSGQEEEEEEKQVDAVEFEDALGFFISKSSAEQQERAFSVLQSLKKVAEQSALTKQYQDVVKS